MNINKAAKEIGQSPNGAKLLVEGDLNIGLGNIEGNERDKMIAVAISTLGLEKILAYFMPCQSWKLFKVWEYVDHGLAQMGGEVPDGIPSKQ